MKTISATELTRNTREILDRVAMRGEVVTIERDHILIAQIVPAQKIMTASQALAGLVFPTLTPPQARAWFQERKC